jgi:alanyl-tRNA synthetase
MTARLYYTDSTLQMFDATVVACGERDGRVEVLLDQTAFYPMSGGQPFDTGTLGGCRVLEVVDRGAEGVAHVVSEALSIGARVTGAIDWSRRFDHMQQHTGQHVLSAVIGRALGVRTLSFHLGVETSTIDLARELTMSEISSIEAEANRVVWEDRTVAVRFSDAQEAAALPLRKESARTGELRLVEIADLDLSACGGTHVARTGMIGQIAISGWERFKGGGRLSFVCGGRALRSHAQLRDTTAVAARLLSVGPGEVPAAVERLQSDARTSAKAAERLEAELNVHRAATLRDTAETIGALHVVLTLQPTGDAASLKRLAAAIAAVPGFVGLIVGEGGPTPIVLTRSADVDLDAGAWMKDAVKVLGGRGGGRPEQAQGGLEAPAAAILAYARASLSPRRSPSG